MDFGHQSNTNNISSSSDINNELFPSMSPDKLEFYKTYDVMTGVRIAATLGGFFSLMVLLVVYKSKCKSRSVSEEDLAAVAAAVVEEEERKETERRMSLYGGGRSQLGNTRNRPSVVATGQAFAYHTPLPVGVYARHHSLTPNPPLSSYNQEDENDLAEEWKGVNSGKRPSMQHLLRVPSSRRSSRRFSSVTCSSCDSSYLERRGSALEIGHPIPPPFINTSNSDRLDEEPWDYYYPIDIQNCLLQVIQPTPQVSPCSSQGTLCGAGNGGTRTIGDGVIMGDTSIWRSSCLPLTHLKAPSLAPLAAIDPRSESFNISSSSSLQQQQQQQQQQQHLPATTAAATGTTATDRRSSPQQTTTDQERSLGSDSVFLDEELVDTEDEVDGFSTDSESGSSPIMSAASSQPPSRHIGTILKPTLPNPLQPQSIVTQLPTNLRNKIEADTGNQRRYSSPTGLQCETRSNIIAADDKASSTTLAPDLIISIDTSNRIDMCKKTSSDSDTLLASPSLRNKSNDTAKESRSFMSISCDRLVESLQRSQTDIHIASVQPHGAWSQETLF
ncbi:hypothetical protein O3M35_004502 [Rhynocoris fuscipes]|uniref:Uncharacterized protein n=1 Tax=Rhynocoris fuscipes TaxID=488301 RepID=A0AAW1CFT7_9HEMI